jgi:hypothetical protein
MSPSFSQNKEHYPPFIPRRTIDNYCPWLSSKYLANLAAQGKGPVYIKQGRAVLYPRDEFLNWLDENTTIGGRKKGDEKEKKQVSVSNTRRGRKTKQQEVKERRG